MTASTTNEYIILDLRDQESSYSGNVISSTSKPPEAKEEEFVLDYKKILSLTTMSMKMFANSYYKASPFLETSDIEQIKDSLNNYANNNEKVKEFKNAIIDDLTEFQKQIKTNYVQKLADLGKEKESCEKQLNILHVSKNRLIMDRLAKVEWPYDSKTKEYDSKMAALQIRVQKYEQKIEELQKTRPLASEKDILIYQMHLKEKYTK